MTNKTILFFGEHSVIIETNDAQAAILVSLLFADIPQIEHETHNAQKTQIDFRDGQYHYTLADGNIITQTHLCNLSAVIMSDVIHRLIKDNNRYLAIHAALIGNDEQSILLPATSASGKSSITMWCLHNGFRYHTDELVLINPTTFELLAFTRPVKLRRSGIAPIMQLLGNDLSDMQQQYPQLFAAHTIMLPHRLINANYHSNIAPLKTIIYPQYKADEESILQPIRSGKASMKLMESNVIARNFDDFGFAQMCQLARDSVNLECRFRHFDDLDDLFRKHDLL